MQFGWSNFFYQTSLLLSGLLHRWPGWYFKVSTFLDALDHAISSGSGSFLSTSTRACSPLKKAFITALRTLRELNPSRQHCKRVLDPLHHCRWSDKNRLDHDVRSGQVGLEVIWSLSVTSYHFCTPVTLSKPKKQCPRVQRFEPTKSGQETRVLPHCHSSPRRST